MRKVYTSVDLGSHSIKIVVMEEINNKFVVLSKSIQKSKGIKKGFIVDIDLVVESLKQAFQKIENDLGIKIDNVLCNVPSRDREIEMTYGKVKVSSEVIGKDEVTKVLQNATMNHVDEKEVLVSISPIYFNLDDKENLKSVIGMTGEELSVKAVIAKVPKVNVTQVFEVFKKLGKNIIDVSLGINGDYSMAKDKNLDDSITAVINIGYESMEVGIFNKGILIKNETVDVGSRVIDKDLCYIYDIERKKARFLKETFAVSNTRYADMNDVTSIDNKQGNMLNISQLEISEIVENRLRDLLKLAKKQINILTNKEIRYIIVTGGISEIAGFQYLLESVFGYGASTLVIDEMGVRNNMYSSSCGMIKSFTDKLKVRNKEYTMISESNLEIMTKKYKKSTSENGKVNNILNIFTGNNKED